MCQVAIDQDAQLFDVGPQSVVLKGGFELMFEFGSVPNMADVVKHAEAEDKGISSMPDMQRLWVLRSPNDA